MLYNRSMKYLGSVHAISFVKLFLKKEELLEMRGLPQWATLLDTVNNVRM